MKSGVKLISLAVILSATMLLGKSSPYRIHNRSERPQPQSFIESQGDPYTPFQSGRNLYYSTVTRPIPRDPDDRPVGNPVYLWDFGPLHASDNGDGSATIYTDVAGSYSITVVCKQSFLDADGTIYSETTQRSE